MSSESDAAIWPTRKLHMQFFLRVRDVLGRVRWGTVLLGYALRGMPVRDASMF